MVTDRRHRHANAVGKAGPRTRLSDVKHQKVSVPLNCTMRASCSSDGCSHDEP